MQKISELSQKDIVNMENGKRLGHLNDLDINLESGKIEAIVIAGTGKVMQLLGQRDAAELVIPWKNIVKIGSDVILVEVPERYQPKSGVSPMEEARKKG